MPRPQQPRFISVSACRRSMGKPLARPTSYEIHLPGAYLTFAELMSKRPRLLHVVAPRLPIPQGFRSVASLHTSTRIDDEANHLHRFFSAASRGGWGLTHFDGKFLRKCRPIITEELSTETRRNSRGDLAMLVLKEEGRNQSTCLITPIELIISVPPWLIAIG